MGLCTNIMNANLMQLEQINFKIQIFEKRLDQFFEFLVQHACTFTR